MLRYHLFPDACLLIDTDSTALHYAVSWNLLFSSAYVGWGLAMNSVLHVGNSVAWNQYFKIVGLECTDYPSSSDEHGHLKKTSECSLATEVKCDGIFTCRFHCFIRGNDRSALHCHAVYYRYSLTTVRCPIVHCRLLF